MADLKLIINNKEILVEKGTVIHEIVKDNCLEKDLPMVLARVNGTYYELTHSLEEGGEFEVVDITNNLGMKTYVRTLQFI